MLLPLLHLTTTLQAKQSKKRWLRVLSAATTAGCVLIGIGAQPLASQSIPPRAKVEALDGDTFRLGSSFKNTQDLVRLLYIDTPEKKKYAKYCKPHHPIVTPKATAFLKAALKAKQKVLQPPPYGALRDNTNRLLAVLIADGQNVNLALVRQGLALFYPRYQQPPNYAAYVAAEREAFEAHRGIWASAKTRQFWLNCARKGAGNTVHSPKNPLFLAQPIATTPAALQASLGRYVTLQGVIKRVHLTKSSRRRRAALLYLASSQKTPSKSAPKEVLVYVSAGRLVYLPLLTLGQKVLVEGFVVLYRKKPQLRLHRIVFR